VFQLRSAQREEQDRRKQAYITREQWKKNLDRKFGTTTYQEQIFHKHDKDKTGYLDAAELHDALEEMGLKADRREVNAIISLIDQGSEHEPDSERGNGKISLSEFRIACSSWVKTGGKDVEQRMQEGLSRMHTREHSTETKDLQRGNSHLGTRSPLLPRKTSSHASIQAENMRDEEQDCEEADEEEFWELTDKQLKIKALTLLLAGTVVVSIFSDPMVDAINEFGTRIGVSPFYVSFIVTPIASNASEVISGLIFARKKTNESISMTAAALLGAACMNNTLALSIFMALVYFRGLTWSFSAEVISLVITTMGVGIIALRRNIYAYEAFILISFFPLTLALVASLEAAGLD